MNVSKPGIAAIGGLIVIAFYAGLYLGAHQSGIRSNILSITNDPAKPEVSLIAPAHDEGGIGAKWNEVDVPEWTWITVAQPTENSNVKFPAGDQCGFLKAATILVVGKDPKYGNLVEYHLNQAILPDRLEKPAGTMCPDNTLAFVPDAELSTWPPEGTVRKALDANNNARATAVRNLLQAAKKNP